MPNLNDETSIGFKTEEMDNIPKLIEIPNSEFIMLEGKPLQTKEIGKLVFALSQAQGELKPVMKTSINPFYKSTYADLTASIEAIRKVLLDNELAIIQTTIHETINGVQCEYPTTVSTIAHSSGQWRNGYLKIIPEKGKLNAHAIGACITYSRKYALKGIMGIAEKDDDANSAVRTPSGFKPPRAKRRTKTKAELWNELQSFSKYATNIEKIEEKFAKLSKKEIALIGDDKLGVAKERCIELFNKTKEETGKDVNF